MGKSKRTASIFFFFSFSLFLFLSLFYFVFGVFLRWEIAPYVSFLMFDSEMVSSLFLGWISGRRVFWYMVLDQVF